MSDTKSEDNVIRVDFRAGKRLDEPPAEPEADKPAQSESTTGLREAIEGSSGPPQLAVFSEWIQEGIVTVTLDSRNPKVVVPPEFRDRLQLNLNFSLRFGIDDFDYDDDGVRASLSFNQVPHYCDIPWVAVYAMTSPVLDESCFFATSAPAELMAALAEHTSSGSQDG